MRDLTPALVAGLDLDHIVMPRFARDREVYRRRILHVARLNRLLDSNVLTLPAPTPPPAPDPHTRAMDDLGVAQRSEMDDMRAERCSQVSLVTKGGELLEREIRERTVVSQRATFRTTEEEDAYVSQREEFGKGSREEDSISISRIVEGGQQKERVLLQHSSKIGTRPPPRASVKVGGWRGRSWVATSVAIASPAPLVSAGTAVETASCLASPMRSPQALERQQPLSRIPRPRLNPPALAHGGQAAILTPLRMGKGEARVVLTKLPPI